MPICTIVGNFITTSTQHSYVFAGAPSTLSLRHRQVVILHSVQVIGSVRFAETVQGIQLVGAMPAILVKYSRSGSGYHLAAGAAVNRSLLFKVF